MTSPFALADLFLRERGADEIDHPGGTLLAHLRRVRSLLGGWGADPDVQLAGFAHAAYGTDGFGTALLPVTDRHVLRAAVGKAAEAHVYLYGSCDRGASYARLADQVPVFRDRFTGDEITVNARQLQAFLLITAANEYDVLAHNPTLAERYREPLRHLLLRVRSQLPEAACAAWDLRS